MHVKKLLIVALVFVFAATTRAEEPREVTVFAAASLREAAKEPLYRLAPTLALSGQDRDEVLRGVIELLAAN